MQSQAKTVPQYLAKLPPERRAAIAAVRAVIRQHLPTGYAETMQYGMISYVVPLTRYPAGYLGNTDVPLPYAALASQQRYCSLYLMNVYADAATRAWFTKAYRSSGQRLAMGKSCVRFRRAEDLPLDVIGQAIARTPVAAWVAHFERTHGTR